LLEEAGQAAQAGDRLRAYELSVQATQAAPGSLEAWALRSQLATSLEEKIVCMNRLNELEPNRRGNHDATYTYLNELLNQNPFLAYLEETPELYHVVNKDYLLLSIPKGRMPAQPYPPEGLSPWRKTHRWLALALLGLLFAGIPTLLFAPLAVKSAWDVQSAQHSRAGTVRRRIIQVTAAVLFAIGIFFSILFALHLNLSF